MALTRKQRAALRRAPKRVRGRLANGFAQQDSRRRSRARPANGGSQLMGIKQGVGAITRGPFGSNVAYGPHCFNAFNYCHMPLPRAIGPYTVIRTTRVIKSNLQLMNFGTMYNERQTAFNSSTWSNVCAWGTNNLANPMNGAANATRFVFDTMSSASWDFATCCPAAFSIQVMNPNALQTTSGIVYQGRFRTVPGLSTLTTGLAFADNWLSYNAPRLTSAAKLAFRGTHIDAVPFNMSKVSDFGELMKYVDDSAVQITADESLPAGFAPICIYNPDGIELEYLVCCEWRVRFDPSNPAQAAHVHHPIASDWSWNSALRALEAGAHGVKDIVETVANLGQFAQRGMRALNGIRQPLMLTG
uniref:Putative major capsid protein n=1 Tax=Symbiodinium +ssRNA virus TR74740 c13_g1_i1 TaxID=1909298 RepID=A0A1D5AJD3_9VIRU|nr:putative major capsid protein [Symbiodinium +ssRNA virus TR74740 c13_g1_i1]